MQFSCPEVMSVVWLEGSLEGLRKGPLGAERENRKAGGSWVEVRSDTRWRGAWEEGPVLLVPSGSQGLWERAAYIGPGGLDQLRDRVRDPPGGLAGKLLRSLDAGLVLRASLAAMDSASGVELAVQ